jgi:uncharacterized protein GlcG (DUF336 family)
MSKLTLAQANRIIASALATARERGLRPMAVVVLDEAGHVRALQREDGASMFRVDIASGKAWAAVSMGASSRILQERAKDNALFYGALPAASQGRFLAQTGAVLIKSVAGDVIGAVGASGASSDEDESICIAGVEAAGLGSA